MTNETESRIPDSALVTVGDIRKWSDLVGADADLVDSIINHAVHPTPSPSLREALEIIDQIERSSMLASFDSVQSDDYIAVYLESWERLVEVVKPLRNVAGVATDGLREKCPSWAHHSMCRFVLENSPECDYDCRSQSLCITEYCERCYAQLWMEQYSPVSLASAKTVDTQPEASP